MKFLRSATSANLAVKGLGKFPCGKLCSSITKLKSKIQVFFKAILIQFAKKKKKKASKFYQPSYNTTKRLLYYFCRKKR